MEEEEEDNWGFESSDGREDEAKKIDPLGAGIESQESRGRKQKKAKKAGWTEFLVSKVPSLDF